MNIFGKVVESDGVSPAIITIDGEKITQVTRTSVDAIPGSRYNYSLDNFLIFPGFVDVRANSDNDTIAALNGGITCVASIADSFRCDDEHVAVGRAIDSMRSRGVAGKINVSTAYGIDSVKLAKSQGIKISCEVAPHHLFFDSSMITRENSRFLRVNPPIRSPGDRLRLIEAVKEGVVDYLVSDHTPRSTAEKLQGVPGIPHFDTYGPFLAWLMLEAKIDPVTIFNIACKNPGDLIYNFTNRKVGRMLPGYEASITVLNMTQSAIDSRSLFTKCNWSPFDLRMLPGSVQTVFLNGEKVVDDLFIKN